MKAAQYFGKEDIRIIEIEEPHIGENDVLLKIKKVGICGTDLHIYHGGMNVPTPLTIGHEFVGDVVGVGENVQHVHVGDRAVAEHVVGCNHCQYCRQGQRNLCIKPTVIGLHQPGALAEYISLPKELVYVLPEELSYDHGVLVEPLSIAIYAVRKARTTVGDTIAVIGQGPIGLFVDQVAKASGGIVYGFDVMDNRLQYAKEKGYIFEGINSKQEGFLDKFRTLAESDGADIVFEAVGREETAQLAFESAKPGGKVMMLGVFGQNISVNMMHVVKKELRVQGSWTCIFAFEPTIQLLRTGTINIDGLITHRYHFTETKKAFEESSSYSDNRIKTVIEFD